MTFDELASTSELVRLELEELQAAFLTCLEAYAEGTTVELDQADGALWDSVLDLMVGCSQC